MESNRVSILLIILLAVFGILSVAALSATERAFAKAPGSITGSTVTTEDCYQAGQTQVLCFTLHNASTDAEWLDAVRLTFPDYPGYGPWSVSCTSQDATDSSGNPVNFTCNIPSANEVRYDDNDSDGIGEVTAGSSWGFCINAIIPINYNGPRIINWGLSGDEESGSALPHDIIGTLTIEECSPVMLKPGSMVAGGCNGVTQTHEFELWNNTGSGGTFNLTYDVPSGNAIFTGPSGYYLSAGEIVTFTVQLVPDRCLGTGEQLTATLQASGNAESDSATIVKTISAFSGWTTRASSPIPTMDNVVACAVHDGGLWSVGGYGAQGATQRYDLATNTWITGATEMSPTIEYPGDGCYGLDGEGHEVIVLFPDTIVTDTLHRYDIDANEWETLAVPAFYPVEGRWAQDIVSLYGVTGDNVCYLSGGATQVGGGRTRNLWVYYPAMNNGSYLGNFKGDFWFNFHASWYVPWVGNAGAICVGGGISFKSEVNSATQCYDLETGTFNEPNADLGPLPEPWWGMADGWQLRQGQHQIWIANGVAQDGTLLPASAYADATTGGFVYGPGPPVGLYRMEGDGCMGNFYVEQGAAGGFSYTSHNLILEQCPWCAQTYLPLVLRNYQ